MSLLRFMLAFVFIFFVISGTNTLKAAEQSLCYDLSAKKEVLLLTEKDKNSEFVLFYSNHVKKQDMISLERLGYNPIRLWPLWTVDPIVESVMGKSWFEAIKDLSEAGYQICYDLDIHNAAKVFVSSYQDVFIKIIKPTLYGFNVYIIVYLNDNYNVKSYTVVSVEPFFKSK